MCSNQPTQHFPGLPFQPLTGSDIHVWCVSLAALIQELDVFFSLLSPDEKARAERFYFEADRHRYIVGRGLLRTFIAGYVGIPPARVEFVYGNFGKPALRSGTGDATFEFNLSHSRDLALYAFNFRSRVGIDIEYARPMPDMDDFAEKFFSPREAEILNSLHGEKKIEAFFTLWTCKEAFLKAHGSGLMFPLNRVEITLDAGEAARIEAIEGDSKQALHWRLESFRPVTGYQASLVVEGGHDGQVVFNNHYAPG
jgi:4'-phosphopantetheinyl transferase